MPESPLSYLLSAHTSPARMAVDTPDIEALRRRKREEEAFLAQDPFRVPPIADPTDVKLADAVAEGGAAMSEDLGADQETASQLGQVFSAVTQLHPAVALTTPIVDAASDKDPQSIWMATQSGLNAVNPLAKLQKLGKAMTPDITPKAPVTPEPEQLPLPLETPPPHFDPSTAVDFTKTNVDPETGYLYHATNVPNAQDIAETGHVNVFAPDYGTDQDMWPDASTENRSYWTQGGGKTASSFAPEGGQPVLLRTKQTPSFKRESGTGDWYTTEPVTEVEYLTPNGWRRLGAPEKTLSDTLAGAVAEPPPPAAAPAGVDPPTAPQMYHPVSKIKLRQPFAELTSTTAEGPGLLPMKEFSFEDAPMGSIFTPLLGDRTQGGKLLTSVNDLKFENPVELQAGGDFLRRAHNPDDAFWASDKGVITTYADLFRELQKSGDPLYATHVAMGSRSGDYSAQTTKALLEMIKHYPLSEEAKQAIDTGMRTPWGAGKKPIPATPTGQVSITSPTNISRVPAVRGPSSRNSWIPQKSLISAAPMSARLAKLSPTPSCSTHHRSAPATASPGSGQRRSSRSMTRQCRTSTTPRSWRPRAAPSKAASSRSRGWCSGRIGSDSRSPASMLPSCSARSRPSR